MKTNRIIICAFLWGCCFLVAIGRADTLLLQNGNRVSGTILQTNGDQLLLLTSDAAFNFKISDLKETQIEPITDSQPSEGGKFLNFKRTLLRLSKQPWATNLAQIPATVIDKGVFKNVPYNSFRCGEDYEFNIYGDLDNPAGIEIGVYRKLLDNPAAKLNCLNLINDLLTHSSDKAVVQKLNLKSEVPRYFRWS